LWKINALFDDMIASVLALFGRIVVVICFIIRGYVGVEVTGNNAVVNVGANVNEWMGWDGIHNGHCGIGEGLA
jgi:hypothetical protein